MEEMIFEYKKVDLNNLERFIEIYKASLLRDVDLNYFNWKYVNNPAGEVIAFEATHNGNVAAFYGMIPEKYNVNGKEVIIYQSMDTMTHPDYQKKGLFVTLAKMCYNYILEINPSTFFIGIPGSNSIYGFVNKLDWKNIHNSSYVFLNRTLFKSYNFFNSKNSKIKIKEINNFEMLKSEELNYNLTDSNLIQPLISNDLIKWKVFQHPYKKTHLISIYDSNQLIGFCIYSIDENIKIEFLQLDFFPKYVMNEICDYLFQKHRNNKFIYTWKPTSKILDSQYKRNLFFENKFSKGPFSYRVPFIIFTRQEHIYNISLLDSNNFNLQPFLQD